jgi:hypothetical protein
LKKNICSENIVIFKPVIKANKALIVINCGVFPEPETMQEDWTGLSVCVMVSIFFFRIFLKLTTKYCIFKSSSFLDMTLCGPVEILDISAEQTKSS